MTIPSRDSGSPGTSRVIWAEVPREIQLRQICHFFRADPGYGSGVARALGIDLEKEMARLGVSANGNGQAGIRADAASRRYRLQRQSAGPPACSRQRSSPTRRHCDATNVFGATTKPSRQ